MLDTLECSSEFSRQLWTHWLKVVEAFTHKASPAEPVSTEGVKSWRAASTSTAPRSVFSSPICYRGHRLLLLRYMRSMLRMQSYEADVENWFCEARCKMKAGRYAVGLRTQNRTAGWFERVFMREVRVLYAKSIWHVRDASQSDGSATRQR